jgi:hypothetical protein
MSKGAASALDTRPFQALVQSSVLMVMGPLLGIGYAARHYCRAAMHFQLW